MNNSESKEEEMNRKGDEFTQGQDGFEKIQRTSDPLQNVCS